MSYHTILKTSQDYTAALKSAREIAKNISRATGANVFPYRYRARSTVSKCAMRPEILALLLAFQLEGRDRKILVVFPPFVYRHCAIEKHSL